MDHKSCLEGKSCSRNMFISPLDFDKDGSIIPVFPAENLKVDIVQPKKKEEKKVAQTIALA